MPYKDLERKKEWERLHRPQRLARRRELRQHQVGNVPAPAATLPTPDGVSVLLPIVGGLGLAAYQPKLAIGAGSLALVIAATFKRERCGGPSVQSSWSSASSSYGSTLMMKQLRNLHSSAP